MNRIGPAMVGAMLLCAATAAAQGLRVGVGGGLLVPMVDYSDIDKAGWIVGADITYWFSAPIAIRAEGSYSQTSQKAGACCLTDHTTKMAGAMVDVVYGFGKAADQIRLYLVGGVGFYNVKLSAPGFTTSSDTKVAYGGGVGLAYRVGKGSTRVFLEVKVTTLTLNGVSLTSIPIRVGLRVGTR